MTQYVGLDVADEETSVCVVDQEGAVLVEAKVASEPAVIAAFIRARAPQAAKVGFETGPLAAWHWHELKQHGLPVVCLDARHAKAALACQINKTDRNDAFGLAQLVRMGWYREVQVKSYGSHYVRAALRVRALLVRSRCDFENQVRGLLKIFGLRLGKTGRKASQGEWPSSSRSSPNWRPSSRRCSRCARRSLSRSPPLMQACRGSLKAALQYGA